MSCWTFNLRVRKRDGQFEVECFDPKHDGPHTPYAVTRATDPHTALEMMVPYMRDAVAPSVLALSLDRKLRG